MINTNTFNVKLAKDYVKERAQEHNVSKSVIRDVLHTLENERTVYDIFEGVLSACDVGTYGVREFEKDCMDMLNNPRFYPQTLDRPFRDCFVDKKVVISKVEDRVHRPEASLEKQFLSHRDFAEWFEVFENSFVDEPNRFMDMVVICESFIRSINQRSSWTERDKCLRGLYIDCLYVIDDMINNPVYEVVACYEPDSKGTSNMNLF